MPLVTAGARLTAALLSQDYSQADISTFTVTATAATQCTTQWSIPANDANVGTVYRLTAMGLGTQGSTQQSLRFRINPGTSGPISTPAGFVTASSIFSWRLQAEMLVTATGSAGNAMVAASLTIGNTNNNNNLGIAGFSQTVAIDTTVANPYYLLVFWGLAAGTPTVSCYSSIFERLGG